MIGTGTQQPENQEKSCSNGASSGQRWGGLCFDLHIVLASVENQIGQGACQSSHSKARVWEE